MSVISWIVLGLIAGLIAKSLLGGRAQHGVIVTILIGIAGALLGGWAGGNSSASDTLNHPSQRTQIS